MTTEDAREIAAAEEVARQQIAEIHAKIIGRVESSELRRTAQAVVDARFKPDGSWDELKNAIAELAGALDKK